MANLSNLVMNFLQSQIFPFVVTFIIVGLVVGGLALMIEEAQIHTNELVSEHEIGQKGIWHL